MSRFHFLSAAAIAWAAVGIPDNRATGDTARTRELVRVLSADTPLAERARACQMLAMVGTPEAVPALARWLGDERLGAYAREALEAMAVPAADAALRSALGTLQGDRLIGVVNSLGARRDSQAVPALKELAADPAKGAAPAALIALGRIATPEAVAVLEAVLGNAGETRRADAGEACVLAAGRLLAMGRRTEAMALYDALRQPRVPAPARLSGLRGAILLRGAGGLALLRESLRSADPAVRAVALGALRELSGDGVIPAVVADMGSLDGGTQASIIAALMDRGDGRALPAVEQWATAADGQVRIAALRALGRLGGDSSLPLLQRALLGKNSAEAETARRSLAEIKAPATNTVIMEALASAATGTKLKLIPVLGDRNIESATPQLLALSSDPDAAVRKAALRALGIVAPPRVLPELIRLSLATADADTRTLADQAIYAASMRIPEPGRRVEPLVEAFSAAKAPTARAALLLPLGAVVRGVGGSSAAFAVVKDALGDADPMVREAAVKCLSTWPDGTPALALLAYVRTEPAAVGRDVAFAGAIRMASQAAVGRDRTGLDPLACLTEANRVARTDAERTAVIFGLGKLQRIEALRLLEPYLGMASLKGEAAAAVIQVGQGSWVATSDPYIRRMLEGIATAAADPALRAKAAQLIKSGGNTPEPRRPVALFNGADLSGWEGNSAVWCVREGAIVGGSLEGNPQNEFLATVRSYRNFVLRLEYKLVGTQGLNAGVQFRSVRTTKPPNEMSGYQADIASGISGSLFDESLRHRFLVRLPKELAMRLEHRGDWNRYEIRCEGPQIQLWLNGEKTVDYTETEPNIAFDGLIGLQIHGGGKAQVAYRNIVIEELP